MGDPKKTKKKYIRPRKPWDRTRLDEERKLKETYGLKNKKELWGLEQILKSKRQNARKLLALELERRLKREKELMDSLKKIGLVKENASLDDILSLRIEEFLERRLQTIVWRKGLANTVKQARQFIVHGHIAINGKKVTKPSYIVKTEEEGKINYYKKPLKLKQEKPKTKKDLKKEFKKAESTEGAEKQLKTEGKNKDLVKEKTETKKESPKAEKETPKTKKKKEEKPKKEKTEDKKTETKEKEEKEPQKTEEKPAEKSDEKPKTEKPAFEKSRVAKTKEKEQGEEK